jgi:fatty-acyl-CoA synthase
VTALITDGLEWWARETPETPAIIFDGRDTVSYQELERWTRAVAHGLVARGVKVGDRVGLIGANSLEWAVAAIGALRAGAIVAPYNQRFVTEELRYLVDNSDPMMVLAGEAHLERMRSVQETHRFDLVPLSEVSHQREAQADPVPPLTVDPDQPAVIVYTSGTTAQPKGVVFTHRTALSFIFEVGLIEPAIRPGARMIFLLSLAGAPGILWHLLHMTTRGGVLYLETGFDPKSALQRLSEERIQILMGVPVLYEQMAALPDFQEADLGSLELVTVGGARVSVAVLEAWLSKGVTVRQIYGMTELGGTSTSNRERDSVARPDAVGRGSIFTRHRVVRSDGTDCEPGEPGEIVVRGPSVTPGYWRNQEATKQALVDGWFHSGDIGVFGDDGLLRMVDRKKDMIISGGYNIAPSEIEAVISGVPGVEEVAVIPVDDAKFGETPAAIIYTASPMTAEEVVEHCRGHLASYKVPRYVVFVPEPLPRMLSGKLAKRDLRIHYGDVSGLKRLG